MTRLFVLALKRKAYPRVDYLTALTERLLMEIVVVGINHKTSEIDVREKFYLSTLERELLISDLKNHPAVTEAIVLSTCNRTEIYAGLIDGIYTNDCSTILSALFQIKKISSPSSFLGQFYSYYGRTAVEHLLTVVTGLDSMVLGEKQILGQFKTAVELSRSKGFLSKTFNLLSNIAFRAGKKAQHETNIGAGGSSVSWAAVTKASEQLGTLRDKEVLVIGAGKMSELTAGQLNNRGIKELFIVNRTEENARVLARRFQGRVIPFYDVQTALERVDVAICSAGCPHYLIDVPLTRKVLRERAGRPLLLIDISMPRNIDPAVANIQGVRLLSLDQLDQVVEDNLQFRQSAIRDVEKIISDKIEEFFGKLSKTSYEGELEVNI